MKSGRTQVELIALYEELGQLSGGRGADGLRSQDRQALCRGGRRRGSARAGAVALAGY